MKTDFVDGELHVMSSQRASFSYDGALFEGRVELEEELLVRLKELEVEPDQYGLKLFRAIFNDSWLKQGLDGARAAARRESKFLCFRLRIDHELPPAVHGLFWELMNDGAGFAPARSQEVAFSRYSAVGREPGKRLSPGVRPRLLAVISAPADVARYKLADLEFAEHVELLGKALTPAMKALEVDFLDPPVTAGRIRKKLLEGNYPFLHFVGHGTVERYGGSRLVLENSKGLTEFLAERDLFEIFKGCRKLRLITLIACSSAKASNDDIWSGLAGRLVSQGVPAVLAMRRDVTIKKGYRFTRHFYEQFVRHRRIDVAVNEARQQLYLEDRENLAWSIPVLYMRMRDSLVLPRAGKEPEDEQIPPSPWRLRVAIAALIFALVVSWQIIDWSPGSTTSGPLPTDTAPPRPPPPSAPTARPIDVTKLQKPPYADGTVGLYLALPEAATDTSDWRRRVESSLERAIGALGLELVRTTDAPLLAMVVLDPPALEGSRLNGTASTICTLRAEYQIYHQQRRVQADAVVAKVQQFDRREACLAAVDRLANEVGSKVVSVFLDL